MDRVKHVTCMLKQSEWFKIQIFGDVAAITFGVLGSNKGIPIGDSKKSDSFTIGLLHTNFNNIISKSL